MKSRALVHKSRPDLPADGGDLLSSRDLHGVNRKVFNIVKSYGLVIIRLDHSVFMMKISRSS